MTPDITPVPLRIAYFAFLTPSANLSLLESTLEGELESLGLRSSSEKWDRTHRAQLLVVRGNVPLAQIDEIAETFQGKEIWTIGSDYAQEDWTVAAEKFSIRHLGNLIYTAAIERLIVSQPGSCESSISQTASPVDKLFPTFSLTDMGTSGHSLQADVDATTAEPYIMVVDDNLIVSPMLRAKKAHAHFLF